MSASQAKVAEIFFSGDYDSEFEFDVEASKKRKEREEDVAKPSKRPSRPDKSKCNEECEKERNPPYRLKFLSKDAYTRHKEMINYYYLCYTGSTSKLQRNRINDKTDRDVIRENHQFLWEHSDSVDTWEKQLAKKYYDRLFKEYCIADLSRYKENKVAMRWRTEREVISGEGQFTCGSVKCHHSEQLTSWEVNFGYVEHGVKKNAIVKLRLCPKCSYKLNYHHKRKEAKKPSLQNEELPERTAVSNNNEPSTSSALDFSESSSKDKESQNTEEEDSIWKHPVDIEQETKSREEEFDCI